MRAIKNFVFCWVVVFSMWVSFLLSLLIFMPVRFFLNRETFTWSAEYEADKFSEEMLKVTLAFREVILKRWS